MERYFQYLLRLIDDSDPSYVIGNYELAIQMLFEIEFISYIPNDDNRALDGLKLRERYGYDIPGIMENCTMLEMLIALCERIQWEMTDEVEDNSIARWLTEILNNLGIEEGCEDEEHIFRAVTNARDRQFDRYGHGSFFPLLNEKHEKSQVKNLVKFDKEIWYQMQSYLLEHYFY